VKVLVPVKRVIDFNVKPQVRADGSGVELANVKMSMNPFDEIALEEAVRLKEAGKVREIVVVSIGPAQARETLRTALAVGADRAILIVADPKDAPEIEPLGVAKLLKSVVDAEDADLVILGKQAIDNDMGAVGPMLAGLLGWPQATFASKLDLEGTVLTVTREVDAGLQTVRLGLPAVVTTDLRLNTPRYATLPNIMKAKSKPLEEKAAADLGVDLSARLETVTTREPTARKGGVRVADVAELVDKLKNEAGVL
jgi:electron transfer flavoprotein beta subunit